VGRIPVLTDCTRIDASDHKWPPNRLPSDNPWSARGISPVPAHSRGQIVPGDQCSSLAPILGRRGVNTAGRVETIRHFDRRFKTADRRVSMIEPNARREWVWHQGQSAAAPAFRQPVARRSGRGGRWRGDPIADRRNPSAQERSAWPGRLEAERGHVLKFRSTTKTGPPGISLSEPCARQSPRPDMHGSHLTWCGSDVGQPPAAPQ
jgi:hypothetical protein